MSSEKEHVRCNYLDIKLEVEPALELSFIVETISSLLIVGNGAVLFYNMLQMSKDMVTTEYFLDIDFIGLFITKKIIYF